MTKLSIISVTPQGDSMGNILSDKLEGKFYKKDEVKALGLKNITEGCFKEDDFIIFIASTGIAVRSIAPFIKSKDKDPGVVVIDALGKFAISLLSGHLGGANELALNVSEIINAEPVITTATDGLNVKAPDMIAKENNLHIADMKICKDIAVALVNGDKVQFKDEDSLIEIPKGYGDEGNKLVIVTNKDIINEDNYDKVLKLIRRNIVLGIGCRRDTNPSKLKEWILEELREKNIDFRSVALISSVELKKDEKALINLSQDLECEFRTFSVEEIKEIEHKYEGSAFVKKTLGVGCVCEPVIELSGGKIIYSKRSYNGMTLSIGII